jgi:hypothetical protein
VTDEPLARPLENEPKRIDGEVQMGKPGQRLPSGNGRDGSALQHFGD